MNLLPYVWVHRSPSLTAFVTKVPSRTGRPLPLPFPRPRTLRSRMAEPPLGVPDLPQSSRTWSAVCVPTHCSFSFQGLKLVKTEMEKVGDTGDISLLFFLAGANFWAILGHFWAILAILGHFWAILGDFRPFFGANFLWQNMPQMPAIQIAFCNFALFRHSIPWFWADIL